jgi:adenylate cyclase
LERRLVAILAIDVVGYSLLMRKDEEGTLANLLACRQLIDKQITEHGGRIFATAGDSVLAEFSRPVEAVRCGIDIQQKMVDRNAARPQESQMELRIGVNLGDVMAEDGNLFGDGVNVAARLESLSEPTGMCVSDSVYEQVRDRLGIEFKDVGDQVVKNLNRPVRAWTWSALESAPADRVNFDSELVPEVPSIAVLPFENMSGDKEQEYLADGIAEEIITTLSKVPGLIVVARHSTFSYKGQAIDIKKIGSELGVRYVLEGSVRKSGNRVRITAQLVDADNGHHLWAERYDRNIDDIFELQDEMALKVATALQGEIIGGEMARVRGAGTKNVKAWVQHVRGIATMRAITREALLDSRRLVENAAKLDPTYSAPLSTLGWIYSIDARHGFSDSRSASITRAREYANRSIALDPDNSEAYAVLGFADNLDGHLDAAIEKLNTSLQMNPNHAEVTIRLALTLVFNGQPDDAVRVAEKALRLCPKYPPWYAGVYGFALRASGRYDEAIPAFEEYGRLANGFGHVDLTIVYVMTGDMDAARREADKVLLHRPDFTVSAWAETQLYANDDGSQQDRDALLSAGLPA